MGGLSEQWSRWLEYDDRLWLSRATGAAAIVLCLWTTALPRLLGGLLVEEPSSAISYACGLVGLAYGTVGLKRGRDPVGHPSALRVVVNGAAAATSSAALFELRRARALVAGVALFVAGGVVLAYSGSHGALAAWYLAGNVGAGVWWVRSARALRRERSTVPVGP